MAKIICFASQKGGCGKTTSSVTTFWALSKMGYKCLFVDTDCQRNSTKVLGASTKNVATLYDIYFDANYDINECIQHVNGLDVIASDELLSNIDGRLQPSPMMYKHLKKALDKVQSNYDFIIIDSPPIMGVILGNNLMAADYVIIPLTLDGFGIQGILDFYNNFTLFTEDNPSLKLLGLLVVKYKSRQNLSKSIEDSLVNEYAEKIHTSVFDTRIHDSVRIQESFLIKTSIYDYSPENAVANDYLNFAKEMLLRIEKGSE